MNGIVRALHTIERPAGMSSEISSSDVYNNSNINLHDHYQYDSIY